MLPVTISISTYSRSLIWDDLSNFVKGSTETSEIPLLEEILVNISIIHYKWFLFSKPTQVSSMSCFLEALHKSISFPHHPFHSPKDYSKL
jgi:hypothetical protein